MATSFYAPDPVQSTFLLPGTNTPGNGVKVFFYVAGSSTKETVYQDETGSTAHTNPIVLNSGGNLPGTGSVWFTAGVNYDVVYAPSNDTDPPASAYKTLQDLSGINDVSAQVGVQWVSGPTPTFVGTTRLAVAGDQTATLHAGRRIQTTNTGGTIYSVVTSSVFSTSTALGVAHDSGVLDSGLAALSYGLLSAINPAIAADITNRYFSSMPSSGTGTTNIWAVSGNYAHVSGTNTIASFGTAPYPGNSRTVIFDSALTLTHNSTSLQCPGAVSIVTAAGDRAIVHADTTANMIITDYARASRMAITGYTLGSVQVFSTTNTWTKPSGCVAVLVKVLAAGGGGGGADSDGTGTGGAGGGGAGGYAEKWITSGLGATETVTIGAVGAAGSATNGTGGGNGAAASFGTHATATGGTGGTGTGVTTSATGQAFAGGDGGAGASGTINSEGGDGGPGIGTAATAFGGSGGSSVLGSGGKGGVTAGAGTAVAGSAGNNYGGGGGGAADVGAGAGAAGGAGGPGIVVIWEYY